MWGVVFVLFVVLLLLFRLRRAPKDSPPLVPGLPVFGSLIQFGKDPDGFITSSREKYGPVWSCKFLTKRLTFLSHASFHKTFFLTSNETFSPREVYTVMTPIFGKGVVYDASYPRMREQLQFLATELNLSNFKYYVPVIAEEAKLFFSKWGDEGKLNLLDSLSELIIRTASKCLIGFEDEIDSKRFAQLLRDLEAGINPLQVFYPWVPSPGAKKRDAARKEIVNAFNKVLDGRIKTPREGHDMIESLLHGKYRDGTSITREEQVGIMLAALFAGQHTSSIVSTWTTLYLSEKTDILERVQKEVYDITQEGTESLEYQHVNNVPLLDACVKESLRLHPPLIALMRKVRSPTKVGDYTIPEGDIVAASPLSAMRCADVFVNPEEWQPDRHLPPRSEPSKTEYGFIGFGAGSHKCLGEKFGLLQVKTIVATLLDMYEISIDKVPSPDYTSMVAGPVHKQCVISYKRRTA